MGHIGDLITCLKAFDSEHDTGEAGARIGALLQHLVLSSDVDSKHGGNAPSCVTLSTVHAAKGMEWDVVVIVGVEASLFPHARSVVADEDNKAGGDSPVDEVCLCLCALASLCCVCVEPCRCGACVGVPEHGGVCVCLCHLLWLAGAAAAVCCRHTRPQEAVHHPRIQTDREWKGGRAFLSCFMSVSFVLLG